MPATPIITPPIITPPFGPIPPDSFGNADQVSLIPIYEAARRQVFTWTNDLETISEEQYSMRRTHERDQQPRVVLARMAFRLRALRRIARRIHAKAKRLRDRLQEIADLFPIGSSLWRYIDRCAVAMNEVAADADAQLYALDFRIEEIERNLKYGEFD